MKNSSLALVVVLYHPEQSHIDNIKKLSKNYNVIAVDNTPTPINYCFSQETQLISLNENLGIAKALNIGIEKAKQDYQFALLLDQDSEPSHKLISGLTAFYTSQTHYEDIAIVAPYYYDKALEQDSVFITKGRFRMKRIKPSSEKEISASYVITSGSLLNLSCYEHIGPMKEGLFIDFVDIEWCLRAKSKHYRILGLPWLRMEHEIGDTPVRFLGKKYPNHSPIRHYYYFRNVFMLLRMRHVPWQWKLAELIKLAPRFIVYATVTDNEWEQIKHMSKGILDGLKEKSGKKDK